MTLSAFKIIFQGGKKIITLAVFTLFLTSSAYAEDLTFTLLNKTKSVINAFYASPTGTDDWEDDILGTEALSPGESTEITIGDGRDVCDYDMRFEFQDNKLETLEVRHNLCELSHYTVEE